MKLEIFMISKFKQLSKVDYNTCLAVISLDSVLEKDENYYPQLILKDYK